MYIYILYVYITSIIIHNIIIYKSTYIYYISSWVYNHYHIINSIVHCMIHSVCIDM